MTPAGTEMWGEVRVGLPGIELLRPDGGEREGEARVRQGDGVERHPEGDVMLPEVRAQHRESGVVSGEGDARHPENAGRLREVVVGVPDAGVVEGDGVATLSERHNERPDGDRTLRDGG